MNLKTLAVECQNDNVEVEFSLEDASQNELYTLELEEAYSELDSAFRELDMNQASLLSLEEVFAAEIKKIQSGEITVEDATIANNFNGNTNELLGFTNKVMLTQEAIEIDAVFSFEAANNEKKSIIQKIKEILLNLGGKFKKLISSVVIIVSGWFATKANAIAVSGKQISEIEAGSKPVGELNEKQLKKLGKRFSADIAVDNGVLTEKAILWSLEGLTDKSTKDVRADIDALYSAILDGREIPSFSKITKAKVKRYGPLFNVKEDEEVIMVLRTVSEHIKALVKTIDGKYKVVVENVKAIKKPRCEVASVTVMTTIIKTLEEVADGVKKELFSDEDVYHAAVNQASKIKDEDGYKIAKTIGTISPKIFVATIREIHKLTLNLFDYVEDSRKLY